MFPVAVFVFALVSTVQAGNSSEFVPRAEFEELKLKFEEMKPNFEDQLDSILYTNFRVSAHILIFCKVNVTGCL